MDVRQLAGLIARYYRRPDGTSVDVTVGTVANGLRGWLVIEDVATTTHTRTEAT